MVGALALLAAAMPISSASAVDYSGDPDLGVITLDDTTTSLHFNYTGVDGAATTPEARAWGEAMDDTWELTVATPCEALVHIEWFDAYPSTKDTYNLYVDGVFEGANPEEPTAGPGLADVWLSPGTHTIVVDWVESVQFPAPDFDPKGSYYDITFEVTDQQNCGFITSPDPGEVLAVGDPLVLGAKYYDNDYDPLRWAVRIGTCDMVGGANVAGNQTGFVPPDNTPYSWDGETFASMIDTSSWAVGDYCFIFNPLNEGDENEIRLTRWFSLVDKPTLSCPDGQVFVSAVGVDDVTPVVSTLDSAALGYPYDLTVEGTFYAGGHFQYDIRADAMYSQDAYQRAHADPWSDLVRGYHVWGPDLLEMSVDGSFVDWGAFAADHSYTIPYTGTGSLIDFQIYDIYAQNNTGGLCVDVEPVALRSVSGGGQIIEEIGPKVKDNLKVSFGGHIDDIDGGLVCEWQVNLHNVSDDALDGSKFHATRCEDLDIPLNNTADPATPVATFWAYGAFNGADAWAYFALEDAGEPGSMDAVRIRLFNADGKIYETTPGDFDKDPVSTPRTLLDRGNIQISFYE